MGLRILLIQADTQSAQPLVRFFTQRGDEVWQTGEFEQAKAILDQVKPNLMLMDLHFTSGEWYAFLRQVRLAHPDTRVIMTNKYPDLQREMLAREQQVHVFLREPFSPRWIDKALKRLDQDSQPLRPLPDSAAKTTKKKGEKPEQLRAVRVPVRVKITLPYLLLALLFALGGAYVVSRVVLESIEDRYLNQLIETGRQTSDWMVREEDRLLETLRLVANTQGVAEAVRRQDAEALRQLVLPSAANAGEEAIEVLDPSGTSILSLRLRDGGSPQDYLSTRGDTVFQDWTFVQQVAARIQDQAGDKFSGLARAPWGDFFYVSGPILDGSGNLAGIVLVGKSLRSLARQMHQDTLSEITIYDFSGKPLATTLFTGGEQFPLEGLQILNAIQRQDTTSQTRNLSVTGINYTEILAPWETRGGVDQGIMGVSQAQAFLVRTSRVTQVQIYLLVAASILLVLVVGLVLASRITRPLLRLVSASSEIAQGNLEIKVDANGNDEVAVLAQSFNHMVAGLQEGSIYRDLLGRTVSPEVREQLRQTFTSGNLRLEGQQAVATVLMSDIRGFTQISEKADPATIFQWLNEYFSQIVPIVTSHGGVVNKFDGDAMLAFFGILPRMLSPKHSALAACEAALEILQVIDRLNQQRAARGEPPLISGVGINTGVVTAGGLGTSDRLHYTIIGDTVNTTQRIESLTRSVMDCSGVLLSQTTVTALGGAQARFNLMSLGQHMVKGKEEPITVFQLIPTETAPEQEAA